MDLKAWILYISAVFRVAYKRAEVIFLQFDDIYN